MSQRTFSMELRMDCQDDGKYESMKKRMMILGRQAITHAAMLSQGLDIQPQVAMFTDDFYGKHEVISLMDDAVVKGLEEIGGEEETEVDPELAAAMKG